MATLYKNGTELARVRKHTSKTDRWGVTVCTTTTKVCMSNRRILYKVSLRSGDQTQPGTWKRWGKLKPGMTAAEWRQDHLSLGWEEVS